MKTDRCTIWEMAVGRKQEQDDDDAIHTKKMNACVSASTEVPAVTTAHDDNLSDGHF
jgi:hypothetical protein